MINTCYQFFRSYININNLYYTKSKDLNNYTINSMTTIIDIPNEVLYKILSFVYPYKSCNLAHFYSLKGVCKLWYSIFSSIWLYAKINKNGMYNLDINKYSSLTQLQQELSLATQNNTIEKYYDSRLLHIFGDDTINKFTKLPFIYKFPEELLEYPEKMHTKKYKKVYSYLMNHPSPVQRGLTVHTIHFLSFRIFNSYTNKTKIEFLFYEKKEPYFNRFSNSFHNVYPEWTFSSTNKNEIQYLGDLGLRIKKEIYPEQEIASYLWGKPMDDISFDYVKRLLLRLKCGIIVPQTILKRSSVPYSEIQFYVECDRNLNRIDETNELTDPLVYLN